MKVVLINLPWREKGLLGVRAGSRWPFKSLPDKEGKIHYVPFPFFLAYGVSLLKREGINAELIDAVAEGIDEQKVIERLELINPDFVIIESSTPSFFNDIKIIQIIGSNFPHSRIVLCGPHVSVFPEVILRDYKFIDYVLIGEFEYTLLELTTAYQNGLSLEMIRGLAYRDKIDVKINKKRTALSDLNSLPWPERKDSTIYKYSDNFAGLGIPNVQMMASRGCPFQCVFCLWPQVIYQEYKYRKRNIKDVVDEMEYLIKSFDFCAVYFDDDVFNVDRQYVRGICDEIIARKIKTRWAVMARVDIMDCELLKHMSEAGLYAVKYGIESADDKILDYCGKRIDLNNAVNMIKFTKRLGVKVHLTFCLGLPYETKDSIRRTIEFIRTSQPDSLQFSFATPFPGTSYFDLMKEKGWLLSQDWSDFDGGNKCIIKTQELSSKDLEKILFELRSRFNC